MSVLIKGIEMPQGNSTINVLIYADGTVYTGHANDSRYSAVSVPTPHGRLIDASTRITVGTQRGFGLRVVTVDTLIDEHAARNVPTIIEEEGSDK